MGLVTPGCRLGTGEACFLIGGQPHKIISASAHAYLLSLYNSRSRREDPLLGALDHGPSPGPNASGLEYAVEAAHSTELYQAASCMHYALVCKSSPLSFNPLSLYLSSLPRNHRTWAGKQTSNYVPRQQTPS